VEVPDGNFATRGQIELDFVPDDGARQRIRLEGSGLPGAQRIWIHFNQPGLLTIKATGREPALRAVSYAELIRTFRHLAVGNPCAG
jgi:hypothetical protein